jgi:arylsulfatase A-like enzyme
MKKLFFSNIKDFYVSLCVIILFSACGNPFNKDNEGENNNRLQNVIFILADDLGWKDLHSYGSDYYETPNIDKLAEAGIRFTDAYAANPFCSPTRASILTGQEPGRLRLTIPAGHAKPTILRPSESFFAAPNEKVACPASRTRLPNEYLTFAEVLKNQGYATAFMGKWHLGSHPYIPENQGFDVVVGGRRHPGPPPPGFYFAPWECDTLPVVQNGTHISDMLTDEAIQYLNRNADNPFLLCLWYYDVHAPYQGKQEFILKYQKKLRDETIQRNPTMGAMIENMDWNIGRLISELKQLQIYDNTIIIFTSDNGGCMMSYSDGSVPTNNYPLRNGKGSNYEGGVRVPLIVRAPGITRAGTVSNVVTSSVDHYATILELLGVPFPEDIPTDGVSYLRALEGEEYRRSPIYSTLLHNVIPSGNRANLSTRYGPWRLYKFYFDGPDLEHRYELYNLDEDIGETNNLADMMPKKVAELTYLLDAYTEEAQILLPNINENYGGNVVDAWQGFADTELSVADKTLKILSTGEMPNFETTYVPIVSNATVVLEFDMKSSSVGDGRVAWQLEGAVEYQEKNSAFFEGVHDGNWHSYALLMPIQGKLSKLRIFPSSGTGMIEFRNMKIVSEDGFFIYDWPLY